MINPVYPFVAEAPGVARTTEFILNELYTKQFGVYAPPMVASPDDAEVERPDIKLEPGQKNGETAIYKADGSSKPAKKPWGDFEKGPKGQIYTMPMQIRHVNGGAWYQLPNEPRVSVAGQVEVTKTTINRSAGKKGTVTEEEYLDDYQITIQGIAYNEIENAYPEYDMKQIRYRFERAGYLEVKHYVLNIVFGIQYLKITKLKADRFERINQRWAPYIAECFSVSDFDLT